MKLDFNLDEMLEGMTRDGMKKFVRKLMAAGEDEEKKLLDQLKGGEKNDLADLDEEMHGKPNTPMVEEEEEPKKAKKKD